MDLYHCFRWWTFIDKIHRYWNTIINEIYLNKTYLYGLNKYNPTTLYFNTKVKKTNQFGFLSIDIKKVVRWCRFVLDFFFNLGTNHGSWKIWLLIMLLWWTTKLSRSCHPKQNTITVATSCGLNARTSSPYSSWRKKRKSWCTCEQEMKCYFFLA